MGVKDTLYGNRWAFSLSPEGKGLVKRVAELEDDLACLKKDFEDLLKVLDVYRLDMSKQPRFRKKAAE